VKYWETIADNLSEAGWPLRLYLKHGSRGADNFELCATEREDAGRFIVRANEILTAFLEQQAAICRRFELG
jgi:hypothetical protein